MKKNILNFILSLATFSSTFIIFMPHLTTDFLDLRQQKENEENYQKELAKKAEQKIYLTGKFDPSQRKDFILIPPEYTSDGSKMYLRKETYEAYLKMYSAALKDGVNLKLESATRNFDYQKNLWGAKWTGALLMNGENLATGAPDEKERVKKMLEYNAAPGTSRHHWGTDIDVYRANPPVSKSDIEDKDKKYGWLTKNAPLFGFCQTYNKKSTERKTGYNEERWHWSYLPIARELTQEYKNLITNEDITGFDGDEYVVGKDFINDYVLSINPDCI